MLKGCYFLAVANILKIFFSVPSAAVSCYHDGNRYLILGCIDGVIRVLDLLKKSTTRLFVMPGQHVKTLTCMKVSGDKVTNLLALIPSLT